MILSSEKTASLLLHKWTSLDFVKRSEFNENWEILDQEIASHTADYVTHPAFAIATGSSNTYAITLDPAPIAYVDGMGLSVKINVDNTDISTINVNDLGAKAIKKANGTDTTSGNLKADSIYTLRYNATTGNFILQGEGGDGAAVDASELVTVANAILGM